MAFISGGSSFSLLSPLAVADEKSAQIPDQYGNAQEEANNILNQSLGSLGKQVVLTVSSPGTKNREFYANIPQDKYSPAGDNIAMSYAEVTKRINAAVDKAKKLNSPTTITIMVEIEVPKK